MYGFSILVGAIFYLKTIAGMKRYDVIKHYTIPHTQTIAAPCCCVFALYKIFG